MEVRPDRVNLSFDSAEPRDLYDKEQKPPIILLHGVTYAKESWKKVIQPIADATGRKVYALDARNHGDSGWSDVFDYRVMVEDLLRFIDDLKAPRVILIGHSMGGKTAIYFSLKIENENKLELLCKIFHQFLSILENNQEDMIKEARPYDKMNKNLDSLKDLHDRVEKLIVEDISPKPVGTGLKPVVQKYVELLNYIVDKIPSHVECLPDAKDYVHKFLQGLVPLEQRSSRHGSTDGSSLALTQTLHGNYKWKANLKVISDSYSLGMHSPLPIQGVFEGPTLMLYGTKSPYNVIADRNFILRHFPEACFTAIEGSTHEIHWEYEDVFLKEVLSFINEDRL